MGAEAANTWHHGYIIENGHKLPVRIIGEKAARTPGFQGVELQLSQLLQATRTRVDPPLIGRHATLLSAGNQIRSWLRLDNQGEAPEDVTTFLDIMGTWVTKQMLRLSMPATAVREQP